MDNECLNCGSKLNRYNDEEFCSDECAEQFSEAMYELAESRYYDPDSFEDTPCIESRVRPSEY